MDRSLERLDWPVPNAFGYRESRSRSNWLALLGDNTKREDSERNRTHTREAHRPAEAHRTVARKRRRQRQRRKRPIRNRGRLRVWRLQSQALCPMPEFSSCPFFLLNQGLRATRPKP